MENTERQVHREIVEHAKSISRLADQVGDRGAKIRLIGLALGLLQVMEMTAPRDATLPGLLPPR